jgi:hypothetical protein
MAQTVCASARRSSAEASLSASFSYFLNSADTSRWSSVSRSTASASFIVFGAVFSVVFSSFGGFGVGRVDAFFAAVRTAPALARFIAGEAERAPPAADAAFFEPVPVAALRPEPLASMALRALLARSDFA